MKKTDQLSVIHAAYLLGADTPGKVEMTTGVTYSSAANGLRWIRKANGDLAEARRLRREFHAKDQRRRYSTDSDWRRRRLASSTAWQHRERHRGNGYRVRPGTAEAVM